MKFLCQLFMLIFWLPVVSDCIGSVVYDLPNNLVDKWKLTQKIENNRNQTKIYLPKISEQDKKEIFWVNSNPYSSDLSNLLAFKASIAKEFPHLQVEIEILEKDKDSLLYEWIAKDHLKEKIHGWGRIFSIRGTVVLNYQTENISQVATAQLEWLPVLKQAHIK